MFCFAPQTQVAAAAVPTEIVASPANTGKILNDF
jgi:hypothetical protein